MSLQIHKMFHPPKLPTFVILSEDASPNRRIPTLPIPPTTPPHILTTKPLSSCQTMTFRNNLPTQRSRPSPPMNLPTRRGRVALPTTLPTQRGRAALPTTLPTQRGRAALQRRVASRLKTGLQPRWTPPRPPHSRYLRVEPTPPPSLPTSTAS